MAVMRRVLAGVFALTWFIWPGYGLIDLSVTWDPQWKQVLEAGWGLYMSVFLGVPFTLIAVGKRTSRLAAATQLYVAGSGFIVSAIAALEWQLVLLGIVVAAETVIVAGLASPRDLGRPVNPGREPLMIPATLGAIPWLAYAIAMGELNRQERSDGDITIGIDHYAVQGAYALTSLGLVTFAALWPAGRVLMGVCAGLSAVYLGLVSLIWHPTQGSMNQAWSAFCMLWGAAVAVLSIVTQTKQRAADDGAAAGNQ